MKNLNRIDALKQAAFIESSFDGYLIFNSINLLYLTGCSGPSALLIPSAGEITLYVYSVNYEQTKAQAAGFQVELVKANENLISTIAEQVKCFKIKKLLVDTLTVEKWEILTKELGADHTACVNTSFIQALRGVKDKTEIALMRKAAQLTSLGMKVATETIRPGVKEYEVAAEIEYAMRKGGAGGTAFETIVASGPNSVFPHGGCSSKKIRKGDLVVVDIGATFQHYCSDMTRTFVVGKPTEKQLKIYNLVKDAQAASCHLFKAGAAASVVDGAARKIISEAGHGDHFVHRLGHGVGLEVHESPTLGQYSQDILAAGNVVTVEPGIYIPGFGGIRIEDTVLVKPENAEKLTSGCYSLVLEN
ncbi:MAG: Xaa-Pro peptidase family protein [Candidatus Bathyarchaeota archaeon]|nr:Xaa-Pro peptidase family protein [Candidatus Bathyarchaeota archaeon]